MKSGSSSDSSFMVRSPINLNNPLEVRTIGIQALREALGPVGAVRFMQQYDMGYGDYTKEKKNEPDLNLDQIAALLKTD